LPAAGQRVGALQPKSSEKGPSAGSTFDYSLTMNIYTSLTVHDSASALASLPPVPALAGKGSGAEGASTGTEGLRIKEIHPRISQATGQIAFDARRHVQRRHPTFEQSQWMAVNAGERCGHAAQIPSLRHTYNRPLEARLGLRNQCRQPGFLKSANAATGSLGQWHASHSR
jgi:hypothetical protein